MPGTPYLCLGCESGALQFAQLTGGRDEPAVGVCEARGLELLSPASDRSGAVLVTLRAPAAVALAVSAGGTQQDLRLLLRGDAP